MAVFCGLEAMFPCWRGRSFPCAPKETYSLGLEAPIADQGVSEGNFFSSNFREVSQRKTSNLLIYIVYYSRVSFDKAVNFSPTKRKLTVG